MLWGRHKLINRSALRSRGRSRRRHNPIFRSRRDTRDIEFCTQRLFIRLLLSKNGRGSYQRSDRNMTGFGPDSEVCDPPRIRDLRNRNRNQHEQEMHYDRCDADAGPVATVDPIGSDQQETRLGVGGQLS